MNEPQYICEVVVNNPVDGPRLSYYADLVFDPQQISEMTLALLTSPDPTVEHGDYVCPICCQCLSPQAHRCYLTPANNHFKVINLQLANRAMRSLDQTLMNFLGNFKDALHGAKKE